MQETKTQEQLEKERLEKERVDAAFERLEKIQKQIKADTKRETFPIVIPIDGDVVTGLAYAPDLIAQCRIIDKSASKGVDLSIEACVSALQTLIIPEHTDARILNYDEDHTYFKGAAVALGQFCLVRIPTIKKK